MKIGENFTLEQLTEQGFKEITCFAGYRIFYKGNLRTEKQRYMFGVLKGDNGQEPKYQYHSSYKV